MICFLPATHLVEVEGRRLASIVVVAVNVQHLQGRVWAWAGLSSRQVAGVHPGMAALPAMARHAARQQLCTHVCLPWSACQTPPCTGVAPSFAGAHLQAIHTEQAGDDALLEPSAQHDGIILLIHCAACRQTERRRVVPDGTHCSALKGNSKLPNDGEAPSASLVYCSLTESIAAAIAGPQQQAGRSSGGGQATQVAAAAAVTGKAGKQGCRSAPLLPTRDSSDTNLPTIALARPAEWRNQLGAQWSARRPHRCLSAQCRA